MCKTFVPPLGWLLVDAKLHGNTYIAWRDIPFECHGGRFIAFWCGDVHHDHSTSESLTPTLSVCECAGKKCAVSSSPRPWVDVFALPEKSNMAVTESDPDPKVRKMSVTFNDRATSELSMRAWNWNVIASEKKIFDLITPRYFPIW